MAVVEVAKPVMKRGQALTGTTVAGERSLAFLKEIAAARRAPEDGDTINGLVVAEVKPDRVKLTLGDETEELVLRVAANPKTTPQPAATAQAQPGGQQVAQQVAAGQPPAHPPGTAAPGQEVVNESSLAERRRAARAAAAAAAIQSETNAPQPPPTAQPPQPGAAGAAAQPDTGWAAMYQRYQQRRN
jgi:hypothetical protein